MFLNRKTDGVNKDWLQPVAASLAKLQLVQSQVNNSGHKNANNLRKPRSAQNLTRSQQSAGQVLKGEQGLKSKNSSELYGDRQKLNKYDAELRSPYSNTLFHKWGSSAFITAKQGLHIKSCPPSEEVQIGHKSNLSSEVKQQPLTGPFDGRESCTSFFKSGASTITELDCSLEPSEEDNEKSVVIKPKPKLQLVRQPIHLCLPSAYIESDNDEDDTGMQRIEYDEPVNKKSEEYDRSAKKIKESTLSSSDSSETFTPGGKTVDCDFQRCQPKSITQLNISGIRSTRHFNKNRKPTTQSRKNVYQLDLISNSSDVSSCLEEHDPYFSVVGGDTDKHQENKTINNAYTPFHSALSHAEPSLPHGNVKVKENKNVVVKIREDKNIILRITPRHAVSSITKKSSCSDLKKSADVVCKCEGSCQNDFTCQSGITARTSNKKNCSHDCNNDKISKSWNSKHVSKYKCEQIPVVTIDYDDDLKETSYLRKKTLNDLEAVTSQQSKEDTNYYYYGTQYVSSKEKNFYELSLSRAPRHAPRPVQNASKENTSVPEITVKKNIPYLIKTTKTIEFNPDDNTHKIVSKNVIQTVNQKCSNPKEYFNSKICQQKLQWHDSSEREQKDLPQSDKKLDISKTTGKLFTQVYTPVRKKKTRKQSDLNHCVTKPSVKNRASSAPKLRTRPMNDGLKTYSKQDAKCLLTKTKSVQRTTNIRAVKSASSATRTLTRDLVSNTPKYETENITQIKKDHSPKAEKAVSEDDVGVRALESALYSTSGKSLYTHAAGYLPSDPSYGLIPHYKHWLPEEYKELQMIKEKLAEDDHLRDIERNGISQKIKRMPVCVNDKCREPRQNKCYSLKSRRNSAS